MSSDCLLRFIPWTFDDPPPPLINGGAGKCGGGSLLLGLLRLWLDKSRAPSELDEAAELVEEVVDSLALVKSAYGFV